MSLNRLSDELLGRIFKLVLQDDKGTHKKKASLLCINTRFHGIVARELYTSLTVDFAKERSVTSLYNLLESARIFRRGVATASLPLVRKQVQRLNIMNADTLRDSKKARSQGVQPVQYDCILAVNAVLSLCINVTHLTFAPLPNKLTQSATFQKLLKNRNITSMQIQAENNPQADFSFKAFCVIAQCCPDLKSLVLPNCRAIVGEYEVLPRLKKVVNLAFQKNNPLDMIRMMPAFPATLQSLHLTVEQGFELIQAVLVQHELTIKDLAIEFTSHYLPDDISIPIMSAVTRVRLVRFSSNHLENLMSELFDRFPELDDLVLLDQHASPASFLETLKECLQEGNLVSLRFHCRPGVTFGSEKYDRLHNKDILFQHVANESRPVILQSELLEQYRELCRDNSILFTQNDFGLFESSTTSDSDVDCYTSDSEF